MDTITTRFLREGRLCDKIKNELSDPVSGKKSDVELYYISTGPVGRYGYIWGLYCTGREKASHVSSENELFEVLKRIISDETGHFAS